MSKNLEQNAPAGLAQQYEAAIEWIYGLINFEKTVGRSRDFRLDRTRRLLEAVGNPQQRIPAIHIAGTKGKGSTATMVASILTAAGYKAGLFTSPHITRFEERIRVDFCEPNAGEMVALVTQLQQLSERDDGLVPTYFEAALLMAWCHFATNQTDFSVLEVGLGGRLDATNVCDPEVCVVTSISLDHTNVLGDTLQEIAGEKAGIIKPGVPVVSGVTNPPARDVIRSVAAENGSALYELDRDIEVESRVDGMGRSCVSVTTPWRRLDELTLSAAGAHQASNAALAVTAVEVLRSQGLVAEANRIASGLERVHLPARIEVVALQPVTIVDGAHNEASVAAVVETLEGMHLPRPRVVIFAASEQKDIAAMLSLLLPAFDMVILTRYIENPRAVPPNELAVVADELIASGSPGAFRTAPTPQDALSAARETEPGVICVTGSFFVASEVRKLLVTNEKKPTRS